MSEIISKIKDRNGDIHQIAPSAFFVCSDFRTASGTIYYHLNQYEHDFTNIHLKNGMTIWILISGGNAFYKTDAAWKDFDYHTSFEFWNGSNTTVLPIYTSNNSSSFSSISVLKTIDTINTIMIPFYPDSINGKILSFTYVEGIGFILNNASSTDILYGTCDTSAGTEEKRVSFLPSTQNTTGLAGNGTQLYVYFTEPSMYASVPIDTPWSGNLYPYLKLITDYGPPSPIVYDNKIIGTYSGEIYTNISPYYSYYSTGIYTRGKAFWSAGDIVHFMYLNGAWHILEILNRGMASKSGSSFGWCSSEQGSGIKYASTDNFADRGPGTIVSVIFSKGNSNSAISLSVNGVEYPVIGTNVYWRSSTTVTFMQVQYNNAFYWHVISVDHPEITTTVFNTTSACLTEVSSVTGNTDYSLNLSNVLIDARII